MGKGSRSVLRSHGSKVMGKESSVSDKGQRSEDKGHCQGSWVRHS